MSSLLREDPPPPNRLGTMSLAAATADVADAGNKLPSFFKTEPLFLDLWMMGDDEELEDLDPHARPVFPLAEKDAVLPLGEEISRHSRPCEGDADAIIAKEDEDPRREDVDPTASCMGHDSLRCVPGCCRKPSHAAMCSMMLPSPRVVATTRKIVICTNGPRASGKGMRNDKAKLIAPRRPAAKISACQRGEIVPVCFAALVTPAPSSLLLLLDHVGGKAFSDEGESSRPPRV